MLAEPALHEQASGVTETVVELAPAKINLALHVIGRRADGYHLIESIVTFADIGDRLTFSLSETDSFTLSGRFSGALDAAGTGRNLVLDARDRLRDRLRAGGAEARPVAIHLEKSLPVASGIGGGSADAAATLRGLSRIWQADAFSPGELGTLALSLGADVPMCLAGKPAVARGVGEELSVLPELPPFAIVLGNPMQGVSTPAVFAHLASKQNPSLPSLDGSNWIRILSGLRNDLEVPARGLLPEIGELSALIATQGAMLTRMSGSGATCFGIFPSREAADRAASQLQASRPEWYFQATETIAGTVI